MYKKYAAVISLCFIVSAMIAATILQFNYAYAQKAETLDFLETVRNIAHDDVFVQLRITGGITQNFTIDGNPSFTDAPTIQIVKFTASETKYHSRNTPIKNR